MPRLARAHEKVWCREEILRLNSACMNLNPRTYEVIDMGLQEEIIFLIVVFIVSTSAYAILSRENPIFGLVGFLAVWGVYGFVRISIEIKL